MVSCKAPILMRLGASTVHIPLLRRRGLESRLGWLTCIGVSEVIRAGRDAVYPVIGVRDKNGVIVIARSRVRLAWDAHGRRAIVREPLGRLCSLRSGRRRAR